MVKNQVEKQEFNLENKINQLEDRLQKEVQKVNKNFTESSSSGKIKFSI